MCLRNSTVLLGTVLAMTLSGAARAATLTVNGYAHLTATFSFSGAPSPYPTVSQSFDPLVVAPFNPALGTINTVSTTIEDPNVFDGLADLIFSLGATYQSPTNGYWNEGNMFAEVQFSAPGIFSTTNVSDDTYCPAINLAAGATWSCTAQGYEGRYTVETWNPQDSFTLTATLVDFLAADPNIIASTLTVDVWLGLTNVYDYTPAPAPVPAPPALALLFSSLGLLGGLKRMRSA